MLDSTQKAIVFRLHSLVSCNVQPKKNRCHEPGLNRRVQCTNDLKSFPLDHSGIMARLYDMFSGVGFYFYRHTYGTLRVSFTPTLRKKRTKRRPLHVLGWISQVLNRVLIFVWYIALYSVKTRPCLPTMCRLHCKIQRSAFTSFVT